MARADAQVRVGPVRCVGGRHGVAGLTRGFLCGEQVSPRVLAGRPGVQRRAVEGGGLPGCRKGRNGSAPAPGRTRGRGPGRCAVPRARCRPWRSRGRHGRRRGCTRAGVRRGGVACWLVAPDLNGNGSLPRLPAGAVPRFGGQPWRAPCWRPWAGAPHGCPDGPVLRPTGAEVEALTSTELDLAAD